MPVVLTGASGPVGPPVVRAFARGSPEIRVYVARGADVQALRAAGAKVAVGEPADPDVLAAVMSGAHTLCHLGCGPQAWFEGPAGGSSLPSAVLDAARAAGMRRVVLVSVPGASASARNPYLRAAGAAEEAVRSSRLEHAIVRCAPVYGPEAPWLLDHVRRSRRWPAVVAGTGRQILAPVFVEDLAAVLAAADDREALDSAAWALEGPDRVTADELCELLGGRRRPKLHLGPRALARFGRLGGSGVHRAAAELIAGDGVSDGADAAREFGIERTPLLEGLSRSLSERARGVPPGQ